MKKIIYSFVIMIAAGSLFTSCVTNTEPQGIKDIREAKANYLDALAELRKADAELVKANVAYREAEVAYQQAQNKLAELKVAYEQAWTDAEVAKIKSAAEKEAVVAQQKLAEAKYDLEMALRNIAVNSQKLTGDESKAVENYTTAYQKYIAAVDALRYAEKSFADAEYATDGKYAKMLQDGKADSAAAQKKIATLSSAFDNYLAALPDSGEAYLTVQKIRKEYNAEKEELDYRLANINKEWALYQTTEVDDAIKGFSTELVDWVVGNVKLPAPFEMHYKTELPDNDQVVDLLAKYVGEYKVRGINVDVKSKVLTANFESTPAASEGIYELADIINALSRECVVDGTKAGYDTTGMGAAVAAAEKEYKETLDALTKGVMAYSKVKESVDAYNTAITDSTTKKKALDAALDSLQSKWNALVTVYGQTNGGHKDLSILLAKDSYVAFQNAIVTFAKARKDYFGEAAKAGGYGLDSIKVWASQKLTGEDVFKVKAIAELNSEDFTPVKKGDYFITILDVTAGKETELMARMHAYNTVLGTLLPQYQTSEWTRSTKDFSAAANVNFLNSDVFFSTPVVDPETKKVTGYDAYKFKAADKTLKTPSNYFAVIDDTKYFTPANLVGKKQAQIKAQKGYYENVYNKFWGEANAINFDNADVWNAEKVRFVDPEQDSLKAKFVVETFTDPTIVHFKGTESGVYKYDAKTKKGTFTVDKCEFEHTTELGVVLQQVKENMDHPEVVFNHTLLFDLFCKQQIHDEFSTGSVVVADALEDLQDILSEIIVEYAAAVKAQSDNSQPFYKFVEDLVGKETLDHIFTGLDSALVVAAQYEDASSEEKDWVALANAIAAKEITSKEALIIWFESFMCGEFDIASNSNGGFKLFGKASKKLEYRDIYVALQVADAFAGDQFRTLLSDVLTAFINSIPVDIVATDKLFEGVVGDNIIEKILFGTVRYAQLNEEDAFAIFFSIITKNHMALIPTAVKIFAPAVLPYLSQDFGGKIEELQIRYFAEWAEEWSKYDIALAEIEAEQEVIDKTLRIFDEYEKEPAILAIKAAKEKIETDLKQAKDALKAANAKIAAALEGPNWDETRWAQYKQDQLEAYKLAVEAAEVELAAAEAAYKQVLENHGLAE